MACLSLSCCIPILHKMPDSVTTESEKPVPIQKGQSDLYLVDGATFTSTVVNVVNTIIGAGILSIPSTIHNTGIVGSLLLLFTSLVFSLFGAYYLTVASHYTKKDSFGEIADLLYGRGVKILSNFTIVIYQLGVSTAYFVILFEQVLDLLHSWGKVDTLFLANNKYVGYHLHHVHFSGLHI